MSEITAIYNIFVQDVYFLKTRMLSDVGTSLPAASFRAVLTDLNDAKFVVTAS